VRPCTIRRMRGSDGAIASTGGGQTETLALTHGHRPGAKLPALVARLEGVRAHADKCEPPAHRRGYTRRATRRSPARTCSASGLWLTSTMGVASVIPRAVWTPRA
jgi:hypothetical protein